MHNNELDLRMAVFFFYAAEAHLPFNFCRSEGGVRFRTCPHKYLISAYARLNTHGTQG